MWEIFVGGHILSTAGALITALIQRETTFRVKQISVECAMASSAVKDELEKTRVHGFLVWMNWKKLVFRVFYFGWLEGARV
jgi:hypothetical protein